MTLILRWRAPERPIATRWRGPEGMAEALTRDPALPIAAIVGPPGPQGPPGSGSGSGSGDVVGPATAADNKIPRFDGTTGKAIQASTVTIDDHGNILGGQVVADYAFYNTLEMGGTGIGRNGRVTTRASNGTLRTSMYGAGSAGVGGVVDLWSADNTKVFALFQTNSEAVIRRAAPHPLLFTDWDDIEYARFTADGRLLVGTADAAGTSKAKVAGVVESTSGGFKFPDASVQASAYTDEKARNALLQESVSGWPTVDATGSDAPSTYSIVMQTPASADAVVSELRIGMGAAGTVTLRIVEMNTGTLAATVISSHPMQLAAGVNIVAPLTAIAAGQYVLLEGPFKFQNSVNPLAIPVWYKNGVVSSGDVLTNSTQHRFEVGVTVASGIYADILQSTAAIAGIAPLDGASATASLASARTEHPQPYVPVGTFAATALPANGSGFWGPGRITVDGKAFFLPPAPSTLNYYNALRQELAENIEAGDVLALIGDSIAHYADAGTGDNHWFNQVTDFANIGIAGDEPIMTAMRSSGTYTPAFYGVSFTGTVTTGTAGPLSESAILAVGAVLSFTGIYETIGAFFEQAAGAGTLTFKRGGTTIGTVSAAGAADSDHYSGDVATGVTTSATYTIEVSGAAVELTGLVRLGVKVAGSPKRLRTARFAHGSYSFGNLTPAPVTASFIKQCSYSGGLPIPVYAMGINDSFGTPANEIANNAATVIDAFTAAGCTRQYAVLPIRPSSAWDGTYTGGNTYDAAVAALRQLYRDKGVIMIRADERDFAGNGETSDGLHPNASGQYSMGALFIEEVVRGYDDAVVTLAKMANVATGTVFYRKTAATGVPEVQTLATLKTDLGLTGTNTGDQTSVSGNAGTATALQTARNFSITGGGITAAAVGFNGSAAVVLSASVDAGHITLARMANLAANSIIGNNTGAGATPLALSAAQVRTLLNVADGASANSADATLLARANHTGTQAAATISDFTEASQDVVGAMVAAAGGSYNDAAGTITLPGGGGGSPGGSSGELQYNNAGAFAGAANVEVDTGNLKLVSTTDPAAPTGGLVLYSKLIAGRHLPKIIGPAGIDTLLETGFSGNAKFIVQVQSGTTAPSCIGGTLTTAATMSMQLTIASANPWQATQRKRFATAGTAGSSSGMRTAYVQWFRGNAAGFGGFFFRAQIGQNLNVNGAQCFYGLCASTAALATTAGAAGALLNSIGMGYDTTDASTGNWQLFRNDGTGAATKVDLGANAARNTTHGFDLIIYCPPGAATEIFVRVVNLHTGTVVLDTSYTTDLPAVNTGLAFKAEGNNGAVASAMNLEVAKVYIESDY